MARVMEETTTDTDRFDDDVAPNLHIFRVSEL